jgi:hypothetical protein
MSKIKFSARLFAVVLILIVGASCVGQQQESGIPPAEATIMALNTQMAAQATSAASTLTAVADEYANSVPAVEVQPTIDTQKTTVESAPTATQEPFTMVVVPEVGPAAGPTTACTIKVSSVDLRSGPDVRFLLSGHFVKDDPCLISARYYNWFYVTMTSSPNQSKGWLYIDWLTIPDQAALAQIPQIIVSTDWKWARSCGKYCR